MQVPAATTHNMSTTTQPPALGLQRLPCISHFAAAMLLCPVQRTASPLARGAMAAAAHLSFPTPQQQPMNCVAAADHTRAVAHVKFPNRCSHCCTCAVTSTPNHSTYLSSPAASLLQPRQHLYRNHASCKHIYIGIAAAAVLVAGPAATGSSATASVALSATSASCCATHRWQVQCDKGAYASVGGGCYCTATAAATSCLL